MNRNILFTKVDCDKCKELLQDCGIALADFERFDVESQEGIVELCSLDLFGDAEKDLPIIVCGERVAKGYIQCKQLLDSDKWKSIKLRE